MDATHLLAASVTPVVLISACGLITLALYNRLAVILTRLRACHQQLLDLLKGRDELDVEQLHAQRTMLNSQITKVTHKAKLVRRSLYCLLSAVIAFLACSLSAAATAWNERVFGMLAIIWHFVGLSLFVAGIGWAVRELSLAITPLDEVTAFLETETAHSTLPLVDGGHFDGVTRRPRKLAEPA